MATDERSMTRRGAKDMRLFHRVVRGSLFLVLIGVMSTELFAQERLWTKYGSAAGDVLGSTVRFGGDADQDGFADVVIGAPGSSCGGTASGHALLTRGRDGSDLQSICGAPAANIATSVAGGIDVDQNGVDDFIVGNSYDGRGGTSAGSITIYSGFDGSVLRDVIGTTHQFLGDVVTSIADVDGDGLRDYAVSAPGDPSNGIPETVTIYSTLTGVTLFTLTPTSGNKIFGDSIADAGDVNGDGITDILVGDWLGSGANPDTGKAWLFSGADGSILYSFDGEQKNSDFGYAVAGVGDVDQDGYADFAVGAPTYVPSASSQRGKLYVYSGKTGSLLYSFIGTGDLGVSVAGAEDVNHDGFPDFIATDPASIQIHGSPGIGSTATLYSGHNGLALYHWEGAYPSGAGIGTIVDAGADLDGDGRLDVIFGNSDDDTAGLDAGSVYAYALDTFYCDASPKMQHQGSIIDVQMSQTNPGNLVGLALVAVDGTPTFSFLVLATADSLGRLVVSDKVPRGWANHNIDLQSFAIGFTGKVVASNVEHLEFVQ